MTASIKTSKTVPASVATGPDPFIEMCPNWDDAVYNTIRWDNYNPNKELDKSKFYTDPVQLILPPSLQGHVDRWERTYTYFEKTTPLVVFTELPIIPDYVDKNKHLMCSEIMRQILSAFGILHAIGDSEPFPVEFESPKFLATMSNVPWRPWYHVYSGCKAGKGSVPKPVWNDSGMCIIRLFYCGSWRMMKIDDLIPIDKDNNPLLPTISVPEQKANIIWPLLLTKALLKLASLSWSLNNETLDFDVISCLTGWNCQKVNLRGIQRIDVWEMCRPFAEVHTWKQPGESTKESKRPKSKSSGKKTVVGLPPRKTYLCGKIGDLSSLHKDDIPDISPCFGHTFYVAKTRNCEIEQPAELPELPLWKKLRWIYWARQKGLWPLSPRDVHINFFEMYSPFRECLVPHPPKEVVPEVPVVQPRTKSATTKSSPKKNKIIIEEKPRLIWGDFNKMFPFLEELFIYFKPSAFEANLTITNRLELTAPSEVVEKRKSTADKKKGGPVLTDKQTESIFWPTNLYRSRNEPIFIFIDSCDPKFILFTLQHENSRLRFFNSWFEMETETKPTATSVTLDEHSEESFSEESSETRLSDDHYYKIIRSHASLLIEKMAWSERSIGNINFYLTTMGSTTRCFDMPEGRIVLKLWLKSDEQYVLNIQSTSHMIVGNLIKMIHNMSSIPLRIQTYANEFSNAFSTFFDSLGFPEFVFMMQSFFSVLKPDVVACTKSTSLEINNNIQIILRDLVTQHYEGEPEICKNVINALKVLFANNLLFEKAEQPEKAELTRQRVYMHLIEHKDDDAAQMIQSFFKRVYIRKLLEKRKEPKNRPVLEDLKALYERFFSVEARLHFVPIIMMRLFRASKINFLADTYSWPTDFDYTLKMYNFESTIRHRIEPEKWYPLVFAKFHYIADTPIFVRFNLECPLPTFTLRVFNNDTGEELNRTSYNVNPAVVKSNKSGYTVIAYGWNGKVQLPELTSELVIAHKFTDKTHLKCFFADLNTYNVTDNYIPNFHNIVGRCTVAISRPVSVAFHITTSHSRVKMSMSCIRRSGEVLAKVIGVKSIVLPPLHLVADRAPSVDEMEKSRSSFKEPRLSKGTKPGSLKKSSAVKLPSLTKLKETYFYVEIRVLDNSWPLTETEWDTVADLKRKKLYRSVQKSQMSTSSKKKLTEGKMKKSFLPDASKVEPPFWTLTAFSNDLLTMYKDTTREQEIYNMKIQWEEQEPGRIARAIGLRDTFLETNYIKLEEGEEEESEEEHIKMVMPKVVVTEKATKSHATDKGHSKKVQSTLPSIPEKPSSVERTLKPKVAPNKQLIPLNIGDYPQLSPTYRFIKTYLLENSDYLMTTDPFWVKTQNDEDVRVQFRKYLIDYFQRYYDDMFIKNLDEMMEGHYQRFAAACCHLQNSMLDSSHLMKEAYLVRKINFDEVNFEMGGKGKTDKKKKK